MNTLDVMRENFLADICEHPDDDAPRLIFADWLDDHGESERAKFIRVQCRIAALEKKCSCGRCVRRRGGGQHTNGPCAVDQARDTFHDGGSRQALLRQRELDLLFGHWPKWLHQAFDSLSYDVGCSARDDNDLGVSLYGPANNELGHFDCKFRRGFVHTVVCTCAAWLEHGPAIVRCQPVQRVELSDRNSGSFPLHGWLRQREFPSGELLPNELPAPLFEQLQEGDGCQRMNPDWYDCTTTAIAQDALSVACLRHAQKLWEASCEYIRDTEDLLPRAHRVCEVAEYDVQDYEPSLWTWLQEQGATSPNSSLWYQLPVPIAQLAWRWCGRSGFDVDAPLFAGASRESRLVTFRQQITARHGMLEAGGWL